MKRSLNIVPLFVVAYACRNGETTGMYPVWKQWRAKALTLVFLLCLFGPAARAQEASGDRQAQANPVASGEGEKSGCVEKAEEGSNKPQCISEKVKSLQLNFGRRFARGLQYDLEVTEQTGTVLVEVDTGDDTFTRPFRNPQSYLQKHTFTLKFGELFPERLSIFKRGSEYLKKNPQAADNQLAELLCRDQPLITCLTKGGSWWKRALMGTSVSLTLSERAKVVSNLFVTDPRFGKDFQVHGGFVFDPAKLFPSATNWKSTFDDVKNIDKALALLGTGDARSGRQPWKQPWAAVFIPKVELKVLSQFDFIKNGGELREARFPNRALNTLKLTWDVARAIPDTKSRLDADAIVEALADLENNLGLEEELAWQKRCILHPSQEDGGLKKVREVKDLHPAFKAESCQELATYMKAGEYQLSCVKGKNKETEVRDDGLKTARSVAPALPSQDKCNWKPVKRR